MRAIDYDDISVDLFAGNDDYYDNLNYRGLGADYWDDHDFYAEDVDIAFSERFGDHESDFDD